MMSEEMIGFAAVVLVCSIPIAAIYAFYCVRKLKSEERLAAIAKGLNVPFEPELPHLQRSRRSGILLVCRARLLTDFRADFAARAQRADSSGVRHHPRGHRHRLLH